MSQKKDAFVDDLKKFFQTCGNLLHTSAIAESVTKRTVAKNRKELKDWIAAGKTVPKDGLHELSTVMPLPNYIIDSEYVTYASQEMRRASDENLYLTMEEVEQRLQALTLCEIYEALKRFLKKAYATYLFLARSEKLDFKPTYDERYRNYFKKNKTGQNTIPYFEAYIKFRKMDCPEFLDEFQMTLPFFRGDMGKRLEGLATNTEDVEFCRHQIVHDHGEYDPKKLTALGKRQRENVERMTRTSVITGKPTILPSNQVIRTVVEAFGGMAFLVYVGLVKSFDMKQEIEPHKKKTNK